MSFIKNLFNFTVETTIDTIPKSQPIPICEEAKEKFNCTADWLSQVLGTSISSFNIKPVGGGFTTQSYRINYTSEGNVGETSVFVKYLIREKDETFMMRLISLISKLNVEPLSRKEVFFYNHLQGIFNDHGIRTPRPLYVALEDNGDLPKLFTLIGIQNHFRGLIMMEDLGNCENFAVGTFIPEKYAILSAAKLGQLHALNWYKPIHPEFPEQYLPDAYIHFFNFHEPNFLNRNLNKDEMMEKLNSWKNDCPFLQEEPIRDALMTFSTNPNLLQKYQTNEKLASGPLFQHLTLLHGDFHSGNLLFKKSQNSESSEDISDLVLIDWQCFGYGHPSTEFTYFIQNVEYDPERDLKLMKIYYEELIKTVKPEDYPWEVFQREVEIRILQISITTFNLFFKQSPEMLKNFKEIFDKRGMNWDQFMKTLGLKFLRFAHILEKWTNENIMERIEEF